MNFAEFNKRLNIGTTAEAQTSETDVIDEALYLNMQEDPDEAQIVIDITDMIRYQLMHFQHPTYLETRRQNRLKEAAEQ